MTGVVGIYGAEINWAARVARDEINARGGILNRQMEIIIVDDGSLPGTAIPAANRLIDEYQCMAIIGNLLSNSRISVLKWVAEPKGVPLLNFSFYEGSLFSRYFFHFAALPNQQIDHMIPFMKERFGAKMFFAGNNYEWPRGSIHAAKQSLHKIGGEVVGEEYFEIGARQPVIDALLMRVERSGADVFVPYFSGIDQITLLTRFTERELKKHMAVVMGHYDEMMTSKMPESIRAGFYSSNTYFMSVDTPENKRYLEQLQQLPGVKGIWPNGNGILTNFGEGVYQCVHAFAQGLQEAGSMDTQDLIQALRTVSQQGPQGRVTMNAATQHATVNNYLSRSNADGTFTIIKAFNEIEPVIPARYQQLFSLDSIPACPININQQTKSLSEDIQHILSLVDIPVIITDKNGFILHANRQACKLFDYTGMELAGISINLLFPPNLHTQNTNNLAKFVASKKKVSHFNNQTEIMGVLKNGSLVILELCVAKYFQHDDMLLVFNIQDITARKQQEESLIKQSSTDVITGLPNRQLINKRLTNAMKRSKKTGLDVALLFVDLDNFKLINDTHGHEIGDILLKQVAERLLREIRPGDLAGRFAADEFIVICEHIDVSSIISNLAKRIVTILKKPFSIGNLQLYISASIGIAIGDGKKKTSEDLLRSADLAMYVAKQRKREGWHFYDEQLQQDINQETKIIHALRHAINNNEFFTHFQSIVSAQDGKIIGAELLLRWQIDNELIPPDIFIPLAESAGFIPEIGKWVFHEGCKTEAYWRKLWDNDAPYVSINLSIKQLNDKELLNSFFNSLHETGADPSRIVLEITETSLMMDVEANQKVLNQLSAIGLRIAVDDFGTGYSSLAHLTRLSIGVLKIDRAFILEMEQSKNMQTVIRTIISLGHSLGFKIVAEGIETQSQMEELKQLGCDYFQGYLYSKPMDMADFKEKFLACNYAAS